MQQKKAFLVLIYRRRIIIISNCVILVHYFFWNYIKFNNMKLIMLRWSMNPMKLSTLFIDYYFYTSTLLYYCGNEILPFEPIISCYFDNSHINTWMTCSHSLSLSFSLSVFPFLYYLFSGTFSYLHFNPVKMLSFNFYFSQFSMTIV